MMACNLSMIVRMALDDWMNSHIEFGDSSIALCWTTAEKKRLSLYHRNRCAQIRRATEVSNLYHCITDQNPCDLGTRPDLVKTYDVGPSSTWEKGLPWMNGSVEDAVKNGILARSKFLTSLSLSTKKVCLLGARSSASKSCKLARSFSIFFL